MPEQPRVVLSGWCRLCGPQAELSGEITLHAPASNAPNSVHWLQIMFAPLLRLALVCCQAALLQLAQHLLQHQCNVTFTQQYLVLHG